MQTHEAESEPIAELSGRLELVLSRAKEEAFCETWKPLLRCLEFDQNKVIDIRIRDRV